MDCQPLLPRPMQANQQLDGIDKKLLNEIQWVFPLVDRPYLEIANRHGISEQDVMHRIKALKKIGLVRQINAIFDTRRLGYKSALVAFAVKPNKLDQVADKINEHPGVSHNYERNVGEDRDAVSIHHGSPSLPYPQEPVDFTDDRHHEGDKARHNPRSIQRHNDGPKMEQQSAELQDRSQA